MSELGVLLDESRVRVETVIVQRTDGGESGPDIIRLAPGQAMTFGRGSPTIPVDFRFSHPEVSRLAGEINAVDDHWTVSNLSGQTYVVENPEGGGEHIKVAPRRIGAPVPFELARLILPVSEGRAEMMVFAPQHSFADAEDVSMLDGQLTLAGYSLDETAKYFAVLVALCEPKLREPSSSELPTVTQVIDRLAPLPGYESFTRTGVNFHIDYLAQNKLRLREFTDSARSTRVEYKRAALVAFAVRFDLVREEHLALLPPRRSLRSAVV
jgi:hypothetical protein